MPSMANFPSFENDGRLPPGDYEASFTELRQSPLVLGPPDRTNYPAWDRAWRSRLVDNLETMTRQLWQVGVREIYADGSFTEDKDHPNDIDGYFVCDFAQLISGDLARQLNRIDPFKVWTWDPASRMPYRGYPEKATSYVAQVSDRTVPARTRNGYWQWDSRPIWSGARVSSAFRQSRRDGKPRGIVKIKNGGKP